MWFLVVMLLVKLPLNQGGDIVPAAQVVIFGDRAECDAKEATIWDNAVKNPAIVGYSTGLGCQFTKIPEKV